MKTVTTRNQVWFGYMTSTTLRSRYSLWNDFHFVPESFFVARTGLTHQAPNTNITVGYGFLLLPLTATNPRLTRKEHRPWGQLLFSLPISKSISFVHRLRYDARFKQEVIDSELREGYGFNHRIRFLTGLKIMLRGTTEKRSIPFVAVSNEVLLNFGKTITNNTFDQNRIQLSIGVQQKSVQYQVGYMNRFVQTGNTQYVQNHTVIIWVVHKFQGKNLFAHHSKEVSYDD